MICGSAGRRALHRWYMGSAILVLLSGCRGQWPWHRRPTVDPKRAWTDARSTLLQAAADDSALTRTNAIEALGETLGQEAGTIFLGGLSDSHAAVRFAAAMVVGDLQYLPAKARLQQMAEDRQAEPDRRVLCAVLYALHRLGDDRSTGELGRLLFDGEEEVRADAAMAMGKIGEPSAIGPLRTLLGDELNPKVRWQIRESLALLGDVPSIVRLEAFARLPDPQLRLLAISAMARIRSDSALPVLRGLALKRHPPRVRVAAAGTLARLGELDSDGYELCVESIRDPDGVLRRHRGRHTAIKPADRSSLQQLAARSLGWMGRAEALDVLHPALGSADGPARVAAAMSILRLTWRAQPQAARKGARQEDRPCDRSRRDRNGPKLHAAGGKDRRS